MSFLRSGLRFVRCDECGVFCDGKPGWLLRSLTFSTQRQLCPMCRGAQQTSAINATCGPVNVDGDGRETA